MVLPYGVFSVGVDPRRRVGVAVGDDVLDIGALAAEDGLAEAGALTGATLNPFMALGRPAWDRVATWLADRVTHPGARAHLVPLHAVALHLPFEVADYVDFYSSRHHAENVGRLFRPGADPLPTAWLHAPLGYHGRAGTVVVSGTGVRRPHGLRRVPGEPDPVYGPSLRLDVEAEVGFVVGGPSPLGEPVSSSAFADHVFGVVLVNDWSARDLQAFETVPLGPFLGKSFLTSVSPWVVPLAALDAAWVPAPAQVPTPAAYLRSSPARGLDLAMSVSWNDTVVSRPPFASMYWTPAQQLAHMTVNGASLRTGDLYASGTVSGPLPGERGSLLELTSGGEQPLTLSDGSVRAWLADGDTVTIGATAPGPGGSRIDLGQVTGTVLRPNSVVARFGSLGS